MSLNSNGVCSACGGVVRNIPGRRHQIPELERIHNEVCPGQRGKRKEQTS